MDPGSLTRATVGFLQSARMHVRRPAAWIGAAVALLPLIWTSLGVDPEQAWLVMPVGIACGGLAAAAAIGYPPCGLPDGRRQPWLPLWIARLAWPVTAAAVGAGVGRIFGVSGVTGATVIASAVLTTVAVFSAGRAGAEAVGATSAGLVIAAAASGGAAAAGLSRCPPGWQAGVACLVWACLVWAGLTWISGAGAGWEQYPLLGPGLVAEWSSPLVALAMVTTLLAMAGCFFLSPDLAAGYAWLAVAWFVCLAVPLAADGPGSRQAAGLIRATAGRPLLPGTVQRAGATAVFHAAVLGWPAVVALLLPAVGGVRAASPGIAVACLVVAAAILVAGVSLAGRRGGDTVLAVCLGLAAAAATVAAAKT
jgi:hypothetical protein